jgi:cysteine-rich repeat protein
VKEGSEACDDGNTAGGDGCSATCTTEGGGAVPALAAELSKPALDTQLFTDNMITLALKGSGGFAGQVTLTSSIVDTTVGNPVSGATLTLSKATADLAENGSDTIVATLKLASDVRVPSAMLKINVVSSLGTTTTQLPVTIKKQISFPVTLNAADDCVYPTGAATTLSVVTGTKLLFENKDTTKTMIFHIGGGIGGLAHHGDAGTAPGTAYEQTVTGTTGTTDWYCHNRNNPNNLRVAAKP